MPHIYQIDPAWSELPYAGGTIRENACGPTCLTMVYIFKTGQTDKTPVDVCALAEAGNYAPTGATEWSFMTGGAWQLGLNGTQLYNDRESITQALRSGAPVIAAVRPGTFTNVGHYIVLYGIDDANQIGVYDPNSASRSARRWGVVEVLNEVEAMWAYYLSLGTDLNEWSLGTDINDQPLWTALADAAHGRTNRPIPSCQEPPLRTVPSCRQKGNVPKCRVS